MNRRVFLKGALAAGLTLTLGGLEWRMRRRDDAQSGCRYPGKVIPLDRQKIAETGRWLG